MSIKRGWFHQIKRGTDHHQFGKRHHSCIDIVSQRFGKLVVLEQPVGKGVTCKCDCGRIHIEKYTVDLRRGWRKSCGVCTNTGVPKFKRDEDNIILKHCGVKSTQEIAVLISKLGYRKATSITVKNRVKAMNRHRTDDDKISLRLKGELNPHSKGSDRDVECCRKLYDEGKMPKEISEIMGMSRSHVSKIVYYLSRTEAAYDWT